MCAQGDLADVVRYYEFRSAHCGTTALTTAQSDAAIDAIEVLELLGLT